MPDTLSSFAPKPLIVNEPLPEIDNSPLVKMIVQGQPDKLKLIVSSPAKALASAIA